MIACLALLLALGGAVYAAAKSSKISGNKIKKSSIAGNRFKKDTVTGKQIKESTLTTVPSASSASTLEGEKRFNLRLGFGASQVLFTAGPFTFTATCLQNTTNDFGEPLPNQDIARILISTSENHTVFDALERKAGREATDFLETTTRKPNGSSTRTAPQPAKRTTTPRATKRRRLLRRRHRGQLREDGVAMGENIAGPGCVFTGTAMVETR